MSMANILILLLLLSDIQFQVDVTTVNVFTTVINVFEMALISGTIEE
jgi:hypothetical protein